MSHITAESTPKQVQGWAKQLVRLSHSNPESLPWLSGSDCDRYQQALDRCNELQQKIRQLQKIQP